MKPIIETILSKNCHILECVDASLFVLKSFVKLFFSSSMFWINVKTSKSKKLYFKIHIYYVFSKILGINLKTYKFDALWMILERPLGWIKVFIQFFWRSCLHAFLVNEIEYSLIVVYFDFSQWKDAWCM